MTVSGWRGTSDQAERRGHRVIRRAQIISGVVSVVVLGIGAYLVFDGAIPSPYSGGAVSSWRKDVAGVVIALAVPLFLVGAVVAWRAGMRPFRFRGPMGIWSLQNIQHYRAARWVRCGSMVPQDQIAATAVVATSMSRRAKSLLLFTALTLDIAVQALVMANPWWAALTWLAVTLVVAAMLSVYRDARLAQRWLHAHPDEATSEATSR